jgi:MFS family permease
LEAIERRAPLSLSPWRLLAVAIVSQFGFSAADQGVPLLAGFVKADLGVSSTLAGLAVSSVLFGKIFGSYLAGEAADRIGEHTVLVGAGVVASAFILAGAASPLAVLFPLLFCAGIVGAASTPAGGRLILLAFPPERRGFALGLRQAGIPAAGLAMALILPPIAHRAGWRWSIAAIAAIMALSVVPLLLTAVPRAAQNLARASAGRHIATNPELRRLTAWNCLFVTGQFTLLTFLPLDLHQRAGLSLPRAALLVALAQVTGIGGRLFWGAMSDRSLSNGRKPLLLVVNAVGLTSALALFLVPRTVPLGLTFGLAAVAGVGLIGYQGLWMTMVAETAGPEAVGAAMGFAVTFAFLAAALTPPLYGLAADLAGTYQAVWGVLSAALALALVPALRLRT